MAAREKIYGFQLVRSLCCIAIVIAHTVAYVELRYGLSTGQLDYFGRYGMLGLVSLFFALSGFLSAHQISESEAGFNPVKHFAKRLIRLLPAYWLAIIAEIVLGLCSVGAVSSDNNFVFSLFLLPNGSYILGAAWTLIYDVFFYFFCSFFANRTMKKFFPLFIGLWSVIIIIYEVIFHKGYTVDYSFPNILISVLYLNYFVGCASYYIYSHIKKRAKKWMNKPLSRTLNIFFALLFLAVIVSYETLGVFTWLGIIVYLLLVMFTILNASFVTISPENLLVNIGDRSYGIYLVHLAIVKCVIYYFSAWNIPMVIAGIVTVIVSLLIGTCFGEWANKINGIIKSMISRIDFSNRKAMLKKIIPIFVSVALIASVYVFGRVSSYIAEVKKPDFGDVIIDTSGLSAGFVDDYSIGPNGTIEFDGWAYDPINDRLADTVYVVYQKKSLPIELSWFDRSGVGTTLGKPFLTTCGFHITLKNFSDEDLKELKFYVLTDEKVAVEIISSDMIQI